MSGITSIVCCYNSANRIAQTLEHLLHQSIDNSLHEIIIVDNNCTDDTVSICNRMLDGHNYRIIEEQKPGLSSARIAGAKAAKHSIIAFVDDDNWLEKDYLKHSLQYFQNNSIGMIGGIGTPVSNGKFPEWFKDFQHQYALGPQSPQDGELTRDEYVYGAGQVLRKQLLLNILEIGITFHTSDRIGGKLVSGGDVELNHWVKLQGYEIHFYSSLRFKHFIPNNRLNWDYVKRINQQSGPSNMASIVMYFMERYPSITPKELRFKYYKRLIWLFYQCLKRLNYSIGDHSGNSKKIDWIRSKSNFTYGLLNFSECKKIYMNYHQIKNNG